MNRVGYSPTCIVCGLDFAALLFETGSYNARTQIHRQMSNGICDEDQVRRQYAAIEYERASQVILLLTKMGARWDSGYPPKAPTLLFEADLRLKQANRECIRLKMWPATERKRK